MTTPFGKRVEILNDTYASFADDHEWESFFDIYDLGVPLAAAVFRGGATATEEGIKWIDEAWDGLCEMLEIDSHGEYNGLQEMSNFAASE